MLRLILVRHGETAANSRGIYQGQTLDVGLTSCGKNQARILKQEIGNFKPDAIFASPLKRTLQTAKIIADGQKTLVKVDGRLQEICHGNWEGKAKEDVCLNYPELFKLWKTKPSLAQMEKGENCYQVADRVMRFLQDLVRDYKNRTVLIVGHDLVLRILITIALNLAFGNIWKFQLDNGGLTLIEMNSNFDGRIVFMNQNSHLKNCLADVEKQAL